MIMATLSPGTYETTVIRVDGKPVTHVSLRTWARDILGLPKSDERHVCTRARTGATTCPDTGALISVHVAGARTTFGNRWVIPVDTTPDVIPERTGGAIVRRPDGRIRFVIYLTDTEYANIRDKHEIVDLRVSRKTRRDAKRATS